MDVVNSAGLSRRSEENLVAAEVQEALFGEDAAVITDSVGRFEEQPFPIQSEKKVERSVGLLRVGVGLAVLGIIQLLLLNPLFTSDFSVWEHHAYFRGFPWSMTYILPYSMIACDFIIILMGVAGVIFSGRHSMAVLYKAFGIMTAVASSVLISIRLAHEYVVFRAGTGNQLSVINESTHGFHDEFLKSLYPLFIIAAIAGTFAFCYIFFSSRIGGSGKSLPSTTGLAMTAIGTLGFVLGFFGLLYGQYLGVGVSLVAGWSVVAFGVMLVAGGVGLSKLCTPTVRLVLGLVQFAVFTFCMLQTIYYAYSATIHGTFVYRGQFMVITAITCILAIATVLSGFYMTSSEVTKKRL